MCRVLAVLVASVIAIGIPNFADFISFAGAIANTLGIYILPHLAFLSLYRKTMLKSNRFDVIVSGCIIAFGAVTGSIAAVVAFKDML